jgi:hypothetical protein
MPLVMAQEQDAALGLLFHLESRESAAAGKPPALTLGSPGPCPGSEAGFGAGSPFPVDQ